MLYTYISSHRHVKALLFEVVLLHRRVVCFICSRSYESSLRIGVYIHQKSYIAILVTCKPWNKVVRGYLQTCSSSPWLMDVRKGERLAIPSLARRFSLSLFLLGWLNFTTSLERCHEVHIYIYITTGIDNVSFISYDWWFARHVQNYYLSPLMRVEREWEIKLTI